jgi:thiamine pyrophosphate-dependent acetolactate synthase large subunit-like protein
MYCMNIVPSSVQVLLGVPVDLGIVADVRATVAALLPLLKQKRDDTHLTQAQQHYARSRKALDELARGTPGARGSGIISAVGLTLEEDSE